MMSGNISREGLTKDVKSIYEAGIGGIMVFNIANRIPYGKIAFDSPEHHDLIKHLAAECENYQLSFGIHNCDGWTSSGGPWITPEQSMKELVWSETVAEGGGALSLPLPQPTVREGFYKEIAVLAYPALETEDLDSAAKPQLSSSEKNVDLSLLVDQRMKQAIRFNQTGNESPWVLFDYGKPHTLRSAFIYFIDRKGKAVLEGSDDGVVFKKVVDFTQSISHTKGESAFDAHFEPVTARYFRLVLLQSLPITEIALKSTQLVRNYASLNGFSKPSASAYSQIGVPAPGMTIAKESIMNLTPFLGEDGVLRAQLPAGKWTIFRFGYTSTGSTNWPATKWGLGLECDKFSKQAVEFHFNSFVKKVVDNVRAVAPNAMQSIEIDSWEVGAQNWTKEFPRMFEESKGYHIIDYLPIFAGRYIDSREVTAGVIWDLNKLFCDLTTDNYFGHVQDLCRRHGLKLYVEPYGHGHLNSFDISGRIDVPMGEFWYPSTGDQFLAAVSGAHIYGKNIISAEAFTGNPITNWKGHPGMFKATGDRAWSMGLNEFVFHRFVHQANTHVKPGLTMGTWGSHIDRSQHWWMNAGKAWFEYLARGTYLLQQGHPVADVLVFVGDKPHQNFIKVDLPLGVNYDCTNADVLRNRLKIEEGKLLLPEGNSYAALVLRNHEEMELATLERIKEIVDAGVRVYGDAPKRLPGNMVSEENRLSFQKLVQQVWGASNAMVARELEVLAPDMRVVGKKIQFSHRRTEAEDIYFFRNEDGAEIVYECIFRVSDKVPEFWDPHSGEIVKIARFRNEGSFTRVWVHLSENQSAFIVFREPSNDRASVVEVDGENEHFINGDNDLVAVTAKAGTQNLTLSNGKKVEFDAGDIPNPLDLSEGWEVDFLDGNGHSLTKFFRVLADWKESADEAVRYYSGVAIYKKTFKFMFKPDSESRVVLDLGQLEVAAEVFVNRQRAGVVWVKPYELEIGKYLVVGENRLEIRVVNQWTNKLIGDERFPDQTNGYKISGYIPDESSRMPDWYTNNEPMPSGPRSTFDSGGFAKSKDGDTLVSSGLIGPVHLKFKRVVKVDRFGGR